MNSRRTLDFKSEDDVIAEVSRLRQGYVQSGSWNLPQICWHLNTADARRLNLVHCAHHLSYLSPVASGR